MRTMIHFGKQKWHHCAPTPSNSPPLLKLTSTITPPSSQISPYPIPFQTTLSNIGKMITLPPHFFLILVFTFRTIISSRNGLSSRKMMNLYHRFQDTLTALILRLRCLQPEVRLRQVLRDSVENSLRVIS